MIILIHNYKRYSFTVVVGIVVVERVVGIGVVETVVGIDVVETVVGIVVVETVVGFVGTSVVEVKGMKDVVSQVDSVFDVIVSSSQSIRALVAVQDTK